MSTIGADVPWVVCDFETTGIHPGYHHRVVEVGLVYGNGPEVEGEWTTTINPQRDIGASEIHGLRGADLMDSPTFDQIAGSILGIFDGRVPIAHNASFDRSFFESELAIAGLGAESSAWFCTLRAMSMLGFHPLNLESCCASCGVPFADAHEAIADARACAGLVVHEYAEFAPTMSRVQRFEHAGDTAVMAKPRPRSAEARRVGRQLNELLNELDVAATEDPAAAHAYMQVLARVLEDRRVTDDEYRALLACAHDMKLSRESVGSIHRSYLEALQAKFLSDKCLSDSEQRDLEAVEGLLGVKAGDRPAATMTGNLVEPSRETLVGKTVCFTGELDAKIGGSRISREQAKQLAEDSGLIVKSGVSKKLDLLVVVDLDSLSAKARKAREHGIRVMAEHAFWEAIETDVD